MGDQIPLCGALTEYLREHGYDLDWFTTGWDGEPVAAVRATSPIYGEFSATTLALRGALVSLSGVPEAVPPSGVDLADPASLDGLLAHVRSCLEFHLGFHERHVCRA